MSDGANGRRASWRMGEYLCEKQFDGPHEQDEPARSISAAKYTRTTSDAWARCRVAADNWPHGSSSQPSSCRQLVPDVQSQTWPMKPPMHSTGNSTKAQIENRMAEPLRGIITYESWQGQPGLSTHGRNRAVTDGTKTNVR